MYAFTSGGCQTLLSIPLAILYILSYVLHGEYREDLLFTKEGPRLDSMGSYGN